MSQVTVPIKPFNIGDMKKNSVIVMIGKRNTGKSTLIKDVMYNNRNLPAGCVISATEEANGFYSDFIPNILIKDEYKKEHISNLIKRQRLVREKHKDNRNIDPNAFLIMDDCLFDNKWIKDTEIRRIFLNGRHYSITFLLTMQYPLGIPPLLRSQIDYVFILKETSLGNRKRIYENYASIIPTFQIFNKIFDKLTAEYGCMVIDYTYQSMNPWDAIMWYRANISIGSFKMCDDQLWKMNDEIKKKKDRERQELEEDDNKDLMNMKKAPRIFVQKLMSKESYI
jgi:hypothetical protein